MCSEIIRFNFATETLKYKPVLVKMPHTHLADLANTASLTKGADGPHVALVPGAKLGGVVVGGGVQGEARMHVPGGLQVVALTEQRDRDGEEGNRVGIQRSQ